MTIEYLLSFFIESHQNIEVFDINQCKTVYRGDCKDCDRDLLESEICSIDNLYDDNDGYICFNI